MVAMKTKNPTPHAQGIGKAIAQQRVACGLTQEDMAEKLNIGLEAVSRLERGLVSPNVDRLFELAEIFNCPVTELIVRESTRTADQTQRLTALLDKLTEPDRGMVVEILERLVGRLAEK